MTILWGILGAALLFGLAAALRSRDHGGCTGGCVGCTGKGSCESDGHQDEAHSDITEGVKA